MAEAIIKTSLTEGDTLIVDFDKEKEEMKVDIARTGKLPEGSQALEEGAKGLPKAESNGEGGAEETKKPKAPRKSSESKDSEKE